MFFNFAFPLWVFWALLVIKASRKEEVRAKLAKEDWLGDYGGGLFLSALISLPAFWLIIKIQSVLIVTGLFLFLAISCNLLIGISLVKRWLQVGNDRMPRLNFVRDSSVAFPFLAAGLFWLSATLFPGMFTPVDVYELKYATVDIIANVVIGIILVGFFAWLFLGSLTNW